MPQHDVLAIPLDFAMKIIRKGRLHMRLFRYSLFLCFFVVCIAFAGCSYPSDVGRDNLPIGTISPEETRPICKVHGYTVRMVPSTCTETGLCVRTCINCGDCIEEELPLAEHKPSEKVEGKDAVCTVCGKVLEEAGHVHKYVETVTDSTCTRPGEKVEKCECGDTKTTKLPLAEHKPSEKVEGKDAVCTVCGKVLAKADHVHKYIETVTDSTCTKQGEKVEKCECGDVKSKTMLPLADHKPSAKDPAKDTVCTVCGKVLEKHTHQYTKTTTASTCTKEGEEVEKCACGDTKTTKLPLADHKPSATVAGKDTVCTVCGKVLEAHVHTYKTKTTPSTCVKQGKTEEVCACGDVTSTKTLPLAEHTPSAKVAGKDTVCTVCGKVLEQGIKPTTGANLTAGEVYQNAYYNTNQLSAHGFSFELSVKKKLLIGSSGMEMRGNTETSQEITMGNATLKFPTASHDCRYLYPYILPDDSSGQKYTALVKTKNNSEGWKLPFDLASTKEGLAPAFSSSVFPKMQFANSARDSIRVSLTDSEVWMAYGDILNFLIEFASEFDLDLSELTVTSATFTATVKNNILSTVEGDFKAKAGKQNIEISFSATYSALNS